MNFHREKGLAFLLGVHLTPWHWRDGNLSRWLVFYIGPWRIETEWVRHMENHL